MIDYSHFNVLWCDLEILALRIISQKPWNAELVHTSREPPKKLKPIVDVFLCEFDNPIFAEFTTYRERIMARGFYIGHHFGFPAHIKIINDSAYVISAEDPGRIIWSYLIKYVLTIYAHKEHMLHLKGGCVSLNGKAFLILGRGGSGKTEIIKVLCQHGLSYMGNTHLLVSNNKVFGIKSNVRIRDTGKEEFVSPHQWQKNNICDEWVEIGGILWVKYRMDDTVYIRQMPSDVLFENMTSYSEAVGNWELKEDISDFLDSNPTLFAEWMKATHEALWEFCTSHISYYLNLDINKKAGLDSMLNLLQY